jgi:hypothetical protein
LPKQAYSHQNTHFNLSNQRHGAESFLTARPTFSSAGQEVSLFLKYKTLIHITYPEPPESGDHVTSFTYLRPILYASQILKHHVVLKRLTTNGSRDSSVSLVSRQRTEQSKSCSSIPGWQKRFSALQSTQTVSEVHPAS